MRIEEMCTYERATCIGLIERNEWEADDVVACVGSGLIDVRHIGIRHWSSIPVPASRHWHTIRRDIWTNCEVLHLLAKCYFHGA